MQLCPYLITLCFTKSAEFQIGFEWDFSPNSLPGRNYGLCEATQNVIQQLLLAEKLMLLRPLNWCQKKFNSCMCCTVQMCK